MYRTSTGTRVHSSTGTWWLFLFPFYYCNTWIHSCIAIRTVRVACYPCTGMPYRYQVHTVHGIAIPWSIAPREAAAIAVRGKVRSRVPVAATLYSVRRVRVSTQYTRVDTYRYIAINDVLQFYTYRYTWTRVYTCTYTCRCFIRHSSFTSVTNYTSTRAPICVLSIPVRCTLSTYTCAKNV